MRRSPAVALPLLIAVVLAAAPDRADADAQKIPCVPCSEIPTVALVGGRHAGVPDPAGALRFVIRDVANNPIMNATVWLDFTHCADTRLCDAGIAGQWLECEGRSLFGITDLWGAVTLVLTGAGLNTGASPGAGTGCIRAYSDGVWLGTITVAIADQNGAASAPGVEITDLAALLRDFGTGIYYGRSDFDHDGAVTITDLSAWLRIFGTGSSSEGCAASYCP